ncbi:sterol desaturase family protein [Ideonella sp. DXS29W]|uniref:Sterol desaturase family protein n=1 Tax=Ideonella lacteola TaxID=2984193 RepID=A0ABU9BXU5_9BURK
MLARFLARQIYLLAVGGSLVVFTVAISQGWPLGLAVTAWSVVVLGVGMALERARPFNPAWSTDHGDTSTDASSAVVLIAAADPAIKALLPMLVSAWAPGVAAGAASRWTGPFVAQVAAAVLWIELAKYVSHRAHHTVPALWWLHAMHHSSRRLYWLNNFRFHPLNHLINTSVAMLPLLALGAPHDVLLAALAVTQPVLMLQHLNADTRNGWANHVFSTNELHRWHHSTVPAEANSNFGSALVLWDLVFGTYRPADAQPAQVGLFGQGGGYPAHGSYWRQLGALFSPACCRA